MSSRSEEVITDVELMLETDWPPNIARRLGYNGAHALYTALKKWGRPDLAEHFLQVSYDGLATDAQRTSRARKRGAPV